MKNRNSKEKIYFDVDRGDREDIIIIDIAGCTYCDEHDAWYCYVENEYIRILISTITIDYALTTTKALRMLEVRHQIDLDEDDTYEMTKEQLLLLSALLKEKKGKVK